MDNSDTPSFKCFDRLPLELRLRVWEQLLPPCRVLKIGPRSYEQKVSELGQVWANDPPLALLSTCRESRRVALDNGCFTSNPTEDPVLQSLVWIDRRPRAVYLPLTAASYSRACSLPIDIQALCILDQPPPKPIHVIYIGLSAIVYNHPPQGVTYPDLSNLQPELLPPNPLYEGSDVLVMDLDDVRLPALLECADGISPTLKFHKKASCFLETLKLYWENNTRALELREAWYGTTHDHGAVRDVSSRGSQLSRIELKPAVIFGNTRDALFFGRNHDRRLHERLSGIIFSIGSLHLPRGAQGAIFRMLRGPNYDCGVTCGGRMASRDS
ncbi:uncharacterized protein NECHADRAFT_86492 [Fusarium vanettenii 77-13-4]|uniref:2EXR domain-containing protein n=1 Tax=Fusarium vanettenii (strain ATCC MYA-4622 / CBS 123669 / FGSC 9596 / NRRL 45880 / 77-13-4) TaxID=660122 RepID=C7ZGZ2_FUSV7|nr:uncharacterized protein NECHADRAFT_86492 [Fusarium vanettenii 77-13-4]EEU36607.1 predicted protein [Fusarium vanettenii 77-13-4]